MGTVDGIHPAGFRTVRKFTEPFSAEGCRCFHCADIVVFVASILNARCRRCHLEYFADRRSYRNSVSLGRNPCYIVWKISILAQIYIPFCHFGTDQAELYCNLTVFGWSRCCGLFPDCIKRLRKLCGNLCILLGTCIVFAEPALKGIAAL